MAGFLDTITGRGKNNNTITAKLKNLSSFGTNIDDLAIRNSVAIGKTEGMYMKQNGNYNLPIDLLYSLSMSDIGDKKYIAYFDKSYEQRRDFLRKFSMNGEIEWILDTICDESIVYDENNLFCRPDDSNLVNHLKDEVGDEIKSDLHKTFKKLYVKFGFNNNIKAWESFRRFLIDGFIAYEIVYDSKATKILGLKELDPITLRPAVKLVDNKYEKYWIQYEDNPSLRRELTDKQVIYVSYTQDLSGYSRISYVERLVRSFNLLRLLENTKVIWTLMNATFRMRMLVPIGSQSPTKAQETLKKFLSMYKEDFNLDFNSGELKIEGSPSKQFWRNYIFPVQEGEQVDIETIAGDGPDMQDSSLINYFYERLKVDSKIPFSRYDRESNGGQISLTAEQDREEMKFSRFINRLRSAYQEVIIKPLLIQMQLNHEVIRDDEQFISNLGLKFVKDNYYENLKHMELLERQASFIDVMKGITSDDQESQIFNTQWLINKFTDISADDMRENDKYIEKYATKVKDEDEDDITGSWSH